MATNPYINNTSDTNGQPAWPTNTPVNDTDAEPPSPVWEREDEESVNKRRLQGRLRELKAFIENAEADNPSEITRNDVYYPPPRPPEIPSIGQYTL